MTELPGCADLELPAVPDVQILRLAPGDTLVLNVDHPLDDQEFATLSAQLKEQFPGHRVAILENATLSVLRKEG